MARVLGWTMEDERLEVVYLKVYEDFVLAVCAWRHMIGRWV